MAPDRPLGLLTACCREVKASGHPRPRLTLAAKETATRDAIDLRLPRPRLQQHDRADAPRGRRGGGRGPQALLAPPAQVPPPAQGRPRGGPRAAREAPGGRG